MCPGNISNLNLHLLQNRVESRADLENQKSEIMELNAEEITDHGEQK